MSNLISTSDLAEANSLIDDFVATLRGSHNQGTALGIEELSAIMLMAIGTAGHDAKTVITTQVVLLCVAVQKLAAT